MPAVDPHTAPRIFRAVHAAIRAGRVRSCHDLSEGGLAVAVAEMAFAGEIGVDLILPGSDLTDEEILFSESCTRFLCEVEPDQATEFERIFRDHPLVWVGTTVAEPRLRIARRDGEWIVWLKLAELKAAWQKPLRW